MADPRTNPDDSYHDPYDGPFTEEDLFNFISNPNPSLMDLSLNDPTTFYHHRLLVNNTTANPPPVAMEITSNVVDNPLEFDVNVNVIRDPPLPDVPFSDPETTAFCPPHGSGSNDQTLLWFGGENVGNIEEGNSFVESGTLQASGWEIRSDVKCSSMPLSVRPPEDVFVCSCCQPLRELIHTNGQEVMRLEIHGRIGMICHAILEIQPDAATSEESHYQTFHFNDQRNEQVKEFLEQYCVERVQAGFMMVQDSLASFYQMMSIGLDMNQHDMVAFDLNLQTSEASASASAFPSASASTHETTASKEREKGRTALAAQRERTGRLTLRDVGKYFHLPIEEAAKKMKLCPTVVKKICRRGGLARWPHRKIKCIERKISTWKSVVRTRKNLEERALAEAEIQRLESEIQKIRSEALRDFH